MRIRKHASKILGSASCQAWLSSPAPCVDDPAPPHGELCELNQSPWDVLPSPQLPDFHLSDRPHLKIKQDDDDDEEEEDDDDNNDNDRIILSVLPRMKKKKNMIKKNKKELKKRESNDMCNKSDGKGWRCKKPVQPPHTLCHYHLAQLRSYNAAYRAPSSTGAVANQRRKPGIGGLTDNGGDFYYYYSGFGPWRGKRRSGGKVVDDEEDDDDDGDKDDNEEEEDDDNGVKGVEIDSLEEDGSDDDDEDELEERKRKSNGVCRKRGRRRIKARSLKSLL
ncbi:WRC domain-containing protein [Dioscorea alata]|uniref:WRC domain-containing protein n=1 Tax=Dioscorea alata TaxID=55571 RepID=A0ACB7V812_DIOAL|nr:WRC domain-containing protein [Dioscorea alata]